MLLPQVACQPRPKLENDPSSLSCVSLSCVRRTSCINVPHAACECELVGEPNKPPYPLPSRPAARGVVCVPSSHCAISYLTGCAARTQRHAVRRWCMRRPRTLCSMYHRAEGHGGHSKFQGRCSAHSCACNAVVAVAEASVLPAATAAPLVAAPPVAVVAVVAAAMDAADAAMAAAAAAAHIVVAHHQAAGPWWGSPGPSVQAAGTGSTCQLRALHLVMAAMQAAPAAMVACRRAAGRRVAGPAVGRVAAQAAVAGLRSPTAGGRASTACRLGACCKGGPIPAPTKARSRGTKGSRRGADERRVCPPVGRAHQPIEPQPPSAAAAAAAAMPDGGAWAVGHGLVTLQQLALAHL